jgi:hypothetical protein
MSRHKQSEIEALASAIGEVISSTPSSSESLLCEEAKASEQKDDEILVHKAHGNRHLVMKGKKVGGLLGHIDRIPNVNLDDMSSSPETDGHHAYGLEWKTGKSGIPKERQRRLGQFPSHEEAVAAIKKFHKLP